MLASVPEREYFWPRFAGRKRANQLVIVPLSQETMASSRRRLPSSFASSCGFIGFSMNDAIFSEQRLDDGSCQRVGGLLQLVGRVMRALSSEDGNLLAFIQNVGRLA